MNRIFRRGMDVRLAVDAALRAAQEEQHSAARGQDGTAGNAAAFSVKRKGKSSIRKKLKRALRRVAAAFSVRPQQQADVNAALERIRLDFARELRDSIAMLRLELARSSAAVGGGMAPGTQALHGARGRGVVVVGAGGHAKVVVELLEAMGEVVPYCIGREDSDLFCLHVPVLKDDENLRKLREEGFDRVFIALGSNRLREQLSAAAEGLGFELVNAISPAAIVSPSAKLGRGIAIMANAVVNARTVVEDLAIINTGATVDHNCHIGRGAHIAPQCGLAGNVRVGAGSFLGVGCSVIPGVSIGSEVTVGAGSVVVRDVPDGVTVVGAPAHRSTTKGGPAT